MMTKLKQILSILTVIGLALFIGVGVNVFLLTYLPLYVSIFGVIGLTSLIGYFVIYLIDRMR